MCSKAATPAASWSQSGRKCQPGFSGKPSSRGPARRNSASVPNWSLGTMVRRLPKKSSAAPGPGTLSAARRPLGAGWLPGATGGDRIGTPGATVPLNGATIPQRATLSTAAVVVLEAGGAGPPSSTTVTQFENCEVPQGPVAVAVINQPGATAGATRNPNCAKPPTLVDSTLY